jgi:hypothetical protein
MSNTQNKPTKPRTSRSKKRGGESLSSPRRIKAIEEKQVAALEYRKLGYTFAQIADALGYAGPQGAQAAVTTALMRVVREPAEHVLTLELERLDALFIKPYQSALNGDLMALNACLNLMARKAKLLGLDAPMRSEHSGLGGNAIRAVVHHMTEADMDAAAKRLAEKF